MELKQRGPVGDEIDKLAQQPEIDPFIKPVVLSIFQCWNDCGPNRQYGFGVIGCIPRDAVFAWCRDEKIDEEAARIYWRVIQKLDANRMDRDDAERRKRDKR
jgi:hypothetical protein